MEKEKFNSRIGFILLSAGSAIGLGNIWRFPYVVGKYGGAIFVIIYLIFLLLLGIPVMNTEFAVGRASQSPPIEAFGKLGQKNKKWNILGWMGLIGTYILMFFYVVITGWIISYIFKFLSGDILLETTEQSFANMLLDYKSMLFYTIFTILIGFYILSKGFNQGVEKIISKVMILLFVTIILLVINSLRLDNAMEGLKFYLVPNMDHIRDIGLLKIIYEAMNQAFFTLSLGVGALAIFGSRTNKDHTILQDSIYVASLDTFIAFLAGLMIFPATTAYSIDAKTGPSLIFIVLPEVFNNMAFGRFWGVIFFIFMTFASISTVIAVFESIIANFTRRFKLSRKKSIFINFFIILLGSLPVIFGFNLLDHIQPMGAGTNMLDLYDFIVSSNLLPLGSLGYVLFATSKRAWGFDNFMTEVNTGLGPKFPAKSKFYYSYIIPLIIMLIFISGYIINC